MMRVSTAFGVWGRRALALFCVCSGLHVAGCSSTDIGEWRSSNPSPRPPAARGDAAADDQRVEDLRSRLDLAASRDLALTLAAERPAESAVLVRASRAESDQVFLVPTDDKERRGLAALSSLDYAEEAAKLPGGDAPSAQAQLAWALGTTTHLQPMFSRSAHAQRTLETIQGVLAREPDNVTALATLSVLRLRLATLPWIARAMAWGAPDGSIDEAIETARKCVTLEPSVEHRLMLAKALLAAEKREEALAVLRAAAANGDTHPRDRELRPEAADLLESLQSERT
jgi:hypothetical protein